MTRTTLSRVKSRAEALRQSLRSDSPVRRTWHGTYIFVHINKTGGTSVGRQLNLPSKKHLTAKQIIAQVGEQRWSKAYRFAFVRNPWDKVTSHYKYRVKTNQTGLGESPIPFGEWVKRTYGPDKDVAYYDDPQMFLPQVEWMKNLRDELDMSFVGRFESLSTDYETAAKAIGAPSQLPHLNRTERSDYRSFYASDELIEIVARWFHEDLTTFGYTF